MPGDELVRFRLEYSTSMYEQSMDILNQAKFLHDLNTICKTIFILLLYGSKHGLVRSVTA